MNNLARIAAIKFAACFGIGLFVAVCLLVKFPTDFTTTVLWVTAGGVCIRLIWPTQAEGEALMTDGKGEQ